MLDIEHIAGTGASVGTLANGTTFVFDTADSELLSPHTWLTQSHGYIRSHKVGYLHRFITNPARGLIVDHDNHDKTDCRRHNLRDATYSQNGANRRAQKSSTTKYKGVCRAGYGGKFKTSIMLNGKKKHLGIFSTQEEAHAAYKAAAIETFGEFAHA
jgi:hypothetical protein